MPDGAEQQYPELKPTATPVDAAPKTTRHDFALAFWRTLTHFDSTKVVPYQALRNSVGVVLPLIVGAATSSPRAGLAVATGALYVSYSDGSDPYIFRVRRMLAAGAWCSLAVFLGAFSAGNNLAAIAVSTLWAFAAGLAVSLGPAAGNLGMISLVSLVVFAAQSFSPQQAANAGLLTLAGAVLQTLLSTALWPVQRYGPERRALAAFYRNLARIAETPVDVTAAPPASALGTEAQDAMEGLGSDRSTESLRYLALLSQAERMRLSALALTRLRLRMFRENPGHHRVTLVDSYLASAGKALEKFGDAVLAEEIPLGLATRLRSLEAPTLQLRQTAVAAPASFANATAQEARFLMDALSGQLRATMDILSRSTPAGETSSAKAEAAQPIWLRYRGKLATMAANLNLGSTAFRHALRLASCVALGEILGREVFARAFPSTPTFSRSYWLVMTIALVLKPDFSTTFSRGVLRVAGTLGGLLLTTALFRVHPNPSLALEIGLIFALTFVLRWIGPANYGIFAVAISGLIVLFFAITGVPPRQVIVPRGVNTIAGGAIALIAFWLWPTRELTQIPETMARMLETYRDYFHAVTEANFHPQTLDPRQLDVRQLDVRQLDARQLDRARLESRRARSNLEAAVDRLLSEPGTSGEHLRKLNAILASSHRFAHASMALDAYRSRIAATPGRPAFLQFAAHVEKVLTLLAQALRGAREDARTPSHSPPSRVSTKDWPDLREDYHQLLQSGDPQTERYALINVEADRIVNSLNTLRDQLLAWTGQPAGDGAPTATTTSAS